jgi:hypothetical protein
VCKNWKTLIDQEPDLWKPKHQSKKSDGINSFIFLLNFYFYIENQPIEINWEKIQKQRLTTKRNWITGVAQLIKCAGHTERYKIFLWIIFRYRLHNT